MGETTGGEYGVLKEEGEAVGVEDSPEGSGCGSHLCES